MKTVLFLGGPGNISDSTIQYLLDKEYSVNVVKRSATDLMGYEGKIRVFIGDRDNKEFMADVLRNLSVDTVIDSTCFEPQQAQILIDGLRQYPCRRLIFISTGDVYGYPLTRLPMREEDTLNPPNCQYAEDKLKIEAMYLEAFSGTETSVTVIRPGYSLGKKFAMTAFERDRGKYLVQRIRDGKPVYSPGDGTTLLDAGAAYNTGRMIARIVEDDRTCGEIFNCANEEKVTYDEYIEAFAKAVGKSANIVHIPTDFMNYLDREEVKQSVLNDLAKYHLYFSVEKFKRFFPDFVWEYDLSDAVKDFIAYQESIGGFSGAEEDQFEDKVVSIWIQAMKKLKKEVNNTI